MNQKISLKNALITSGASGLARGCSLHLRRMGTDITVVDYKLRAVSDMADNITQELVKRTHEIHGFHFSVRKIKSTAELEKITYP